MGVAIRQAGQDDRPAVNALLDEVFRDDPVSSWVFPTRPTGGAGTVR